MPVQSDALELPRAPLLLILRRWLSRVPLVGCGVTGVVFRTDGVVAVAGGVPAVIGDDLGRGGHSLTPRVRAGHGGEHAAPAAQNEGKDNTEICQFSRHRFYFDGLINTGQSPLSIRERTPTPAGYE